MNKSRKHFFAIAGFMVIIGALMFLCSDTVLGENEESFQSPHRRVPPAVPTKVMNTPLPIKGKVRITNKPTVQVESTPDKPVWVQNVSEGSYQVFQELVSGEISAGKDTGYSLPISIPAGKLLILEYISGRAEFPGGQKSYIQLYQDDQTDKFHVHYVPLQPHGERAGRELHFASQAIRMYIGLADGPFVVAVSRNSNTGSGVFDVTFSGYLVDIPK